MRGVKMKNDDGLNQICIAASNMCPSHHWFLLSIIQQADQRDAALFQHAIYYIRCRLKLYDVHHTIVAGVYGGIKRPPCQRDWGEPAKSRRTRVPEYIETMSQEHPARATDIYFLLIPSSSFNNLHLSVPEYCIDNIRNWQVQETVIK